MKSILLFRHGKSNWKAQYDNDHERPLSKRGAKAAKLMGKYAFRIKQVPDKINSDFSLNSEIYHCSKETLQTIITKQDPNIHDICLVGHQPTFLFFLNELTGENLLRFPTASMAKITLPVDRWKEVEPGKGFLSWFKSPKELMPFKTTI